MRYGDGLKRRDRQSSVRPTERSCARQVRQDPAACVSLSSNHLSKSKPKSSGPNARFGFCRPVAKKARLNTRTGQASLVSDRRLLPTGRTPVRGARERVNNINHALMSTPIARFSALALAVKPFCRAANRPVLRVTKLSGHTVTGFPVTADRGRC
jgi:hypothetical protein